MRSRMIAFSGGVMLILLLPHLPNIHHEVIFALAAAFLVLSLRAHWSAYPAAVLLGFLWSLGFAQWHAERVLPEQLEGQDLWLVGKVASLPEYKERSVQFFFAVEKSCTSLLPDNCDWSHGVFNPRRILLSSYTRTPIETGQRWMWRVRLNSPHGFANPGGFDYEAWMFEQGLSAKGYVRETSFNQYLGVENNSLNRWRFLALTFLSKHLKGLEHRQLILALVMGVRDGIDATVWNLLTVTGTNHLMVISGLHIGLCSLFAYALGNVVARISPSLLLRVPAQKLGVASGLICAGIYAALAGFTVPTQRALIMLAVFALARLSGRKFTVSSAYATALFLVLLLHPLSVMNAGFWLSFAAVGTLLLALSGFGSLHRVDADSQQSVLFERARRLAGLRASLHFFWGRWVRPQCVVSVGLCVPMIVWLQQVSLLSPVVNFFAIPVVSLIVVPISLIAAIVSWPFPEFSFLLFRVANEALVLLLVCMAELTHATGNAMTVKIGAPESAALICLVIGTLLLLLPRGAPMKLLGLVLLLPALFPPVAPLPHGQARVVVFDVGQGLAVLVRTARHTLLYDTGPRLGTSFDTGRGVVVPYAVRHSIKQLDLVIVSHGDNDHAGGLGSVLELMDVGAVHSSSPNVVGTASGRAEFCEQGQEWTWDGVNFSVLHPATGAAYDGNDSSCVLMVKAGAQRLLLPGDIERDAERAIVETYGGAMTADVLIAPHHGSDTSSSDAFIANVSPSVLIFSAGYRSQFRHPSPKVLERYRHLDLLAYNTAVQGALSFTLGGFDPAIDVAAYRAERQRFWQADFGAENLRLHGVANSVESGANSDLELTGSGTNVLK